MADGIRRSHVARHSRTRTCPGRGPCAAWTWTRDHDRLRGDAARRAARLGERRLRCDRQRLVARRDYRARELRRPLSGRHRTGPHDGSHPDEERRVALRQADRKTGPEHLASGPSLRRLLSASAAREKDELLVELEPNSVVAVDPRRGDEAMIARARTGES